MKSATVGLVMALGMHFAGAQEPPLPQSSGTPPPTPTARPELNIPDIPIEPPTLAPNASSTPKQALPTIQELDTAFQHSSLGAAVEEQRLHLEWRKLQNRVNDDAEVVAAKKAIDRARTDVEKRELMRTYYKVFYGHMQALAETPEVKVYLQQKRNAAIGGLAQPHLRPEPTPSPSPKR
ncbi:MAG: hypothetical protein ACJ8NS_01735 [Chthoniobacterales bacterium]